MKQMGFQQRYEKALEEARELSGLWTNTAISDKLDIEIELLVRGVENGDAEEVTDELFPQLKETITYAEEELQRVEG